MSNSIERVDAPSGATHKTLKGTYMKHAAGAWFEWLHEWVKVDSGVHVNVNQLTEISGDEMNLKKLTQAVFEGLPPEYRWAAVDADGDIVVADHEHFFWHESKKWLFPSDKTIKIIVKTISYDASDWQNSLIERLSDTCIDDMGIANAQKQSERQDVPTADKPESIHDVARSIEAARVAEQSERTYPHYFKDVSDVDAIDLYHVARLYDITDPALFHALKKIACAGKRGAKDQAQDVQEAIDALQRWQELSV